jgi:hypothetical protein
MTDAASEVEALRERARDAIAFGRLPARRLVRSWAGKGSGATCMVCVRPITSEDVELELEFAASPPSAAPRCCRVHAKCFAAWEIECRQLLIPE